MVANRVTIVLKPPPQVADRERTTLCLQRWRNRRDIARELDDGLTRAPSQPVAESCAAGSTAAQRLLARLDDLERGLAAARGELQDAIQEPEGNTARLREALEEQRKRSDDLEKILHSTNVAIIFLDRDLKIRFFTPATGAVFAIQPGDVGRPLVDLVSAADDDDLIADARTVLERQSSQEREVQSASGSWFRRQVMPYRAQDDRVGGVVITFNDITKRKLAAAALQEAKNQADQANIGKSRFLAAASHDLRQPLQTLALLQGLLARTVHGARAQELVARVDDMLGAMSGMLDRLLDINEIETGVIDAKTASFDMNGLLGRIRDEFSEQAKAKGLDLRVLPCSLHVRSDPSLLGQIIRNLLSNALKFTTHGKVLLGCRRRAGAVSVEVWDTGIGIPPGELSAIFQEYHQLDNPARERSRGLGLGLAIVNRLATLLDHPVSVRSEMGRGSVFAVAIGRSTGTEAVDQRPASIEPIAPAPVAAPRSGIILAVEDDPDMRELIGMLLESEGHQVVTAADGPTALALVAQRSIAPDLLLADYNLPNGPNGLQLAIELRAQLNREIPVIILTGDISAERLKDVALRHCLQLNKPVKPQELTGLIEQLLKSRPSPLAVKPAAMPERPHACTVFVVDDDAAIRDALRSVLENDGRNAECFETGEAFLAAFRPGNEACLLVDAYLPGMNGVELLHRLRQAGHHLPAIMITGNSDVAMAVAAMKAGAADFIEKPVGRLELLASIGRALDQARDATKLMAWRKAAANHVAGLTARQREIMTMVLAGHPSKNIATDLGISQRTVENHRAAIMHRTGVASLPALARLALAANWSTGDAATIAGEVPPSAR